MRLDHVVLRSFDAGATLRFATEVLQLPLIAALDGDDWGGHPWLMLQFGLDDGRELVYVALGGAEAPDDGGLPADSRHYAFALDDPEQLDTWRARLARAGVPVEEEDHGDQRSLYFADPDGTVFEVTSRPSAVSTTEDPDAHAAAQAWIAAHPR